ALVIISKIFVRPLHLLQFWNRRIRRFGTNPDVSIFVWIGTTGPEALQRVNHEWKLFKINFDLFNCFSAGKLIYRSNGDDRLAEVHRLIGQRALAPLAGLD